MERNRALNGGGAVYWDAQAPEALTQGVIALNNSAAYGNFVSTPARSLQFVNTTAGNYTLASGEMAFGLIKVAVLDAYGQVVSQGAYSYAHHDDHRNSRPQGRYGTI